MSMPTKCKKCRTGRRDLLPPEILECVKCGEDWELTEGEKKYCISKGFQPPTKCKNCRIKKVNNNNNNNNNNNK